MLYIPGLVVCFAAFGHWGASPSSTQVVAPPIWPMGGVCIGMISRMCPHAGGPGSCTPKELHTAPLSLADLAWGHKVPSFQWLPISGPIGQELQGSTVRVWLWRGYVPARDGLMCTQVHLLESWWQSWKQTVMKHYFYTTALAASHRHVNAFGFKQRLVLWTSTHGQHDWGRHAIT